MTKTRECEVDLPGQRAFVFTYYQNGLRAVDAIRLITTGLYYVPGFVGHAIREHVQPCFTGAM